MPFGHDPANDHGRSHALAFERVEHAKDAAAVPIFGKADGVEIRHARLERVAHGADARPVPVGAAFKRAAKKNRQPFEKGLDRRRHHQKCAVLLDERHGQAL